MTKAAKRISATKKRAEDSPSPEHLLWSIEGRADTQKCALKLYEILKKNPEKLEEFTYKIEVLTATAFALWRAVFLADREVSNKNAHAISFLNKMLVDNNISFAQDRLSRSWSFIFYARTAEDNLSALAHDWPTVARALNKRYLRPTTPRNRWDRLQRAFRSAVSKFEKEINSN